MQHYKIQRLIGRRPKIILATILLVVLLIVYTGHNMNQGMPFLNAVYRSVPCLLSALSAYACAFVFFASVPVLTLWVSWPCTVPLAILLGTAAFIAGNKLAGLSRFGFLFVLALVWDLYGA